MMARPRSKSAARKKSSAKKSSAKKSSARSAPRKSAAAKARGEFVCPECGKSFTRAASLGAHRNRVHGVAGSSTQARARRSVSSRPSSSATKTRSAAAAAGRTSTGRKTTATRGTQARKLSTAAVRQRRRSAGSVNRDALLGSLFPNGIPARESVIRELNKWLNQAERLAKLT